MVDRKTTDRIRAAAALCGVLAFAAAAGVALHSCKAPRGAVPAPIRALGDSVVLDDFEGREGLASRWRHKTFSGTDPASFSIARDRDGGHLAAEARSAGSLLALAVDADPARYPVLSWRWRVRELPQGADLRRREGDDCGARLFVAFEYEPERATMGEKLARSFSSEELPGSSLCYVWAAGLAPGTVLPNAFTDRTRMVVVESGAEGLGEWREARRDIVSDYERAFGRKPPRITGVAFMVDSDQTRSVAAADLDDLSLGR
ncbi:MAG: DUF3047 domain-containing protein [Planctomycetota bacterium]